jgi:hypothetical protein
MKKKQSIGLYPQKYITLLTPKIYHDNDICALIMLG